MKNWEEKWSILKEYIKASIRSAEADARLWDEAGKKDLANIQYAKRNAYKEIHDFMERLEKGGEEE